MICLGRYVPVVCCVVFPCVRSNSNDQLWLNKPAWLMSRACPLMRRTQESSAETKTSDRFFQVLTIGADERENKLPTVVHRCNTLSLQRVRVLLLLTAFVLYHIGVINNRRWPGANQKIDVEKLC